MSWSSPLIVIVGPTAAGKSELAISVARALDGEVVSADAMQVYRGLEVGTAKVDAATREAVPHHCLDLVEPTDRFSAGDYAGAAGGAIEDIRRRHRQPVVAGGSGFYLRALVEGLAPLPIGDRRWRRALETIEARRGLADLYRMLQFLDPEWAARVGPNDRQRISRGLEVTLRLGEPISDALAREGWSGPNYQAVWVGLDWPRPLLRQRIAERVDAMLEAGWLEEVQKLLDDGVTPRHPALRAIGYRELAVHLAGEMSLAEARDAIVLATRQYAKRQLTWFRRQTPTIWFEVETPDAAAWTAASGRVIDYLRGKLGTDTPRSTVDESGPAQRQYQAGH